MTQAYWGLNNLQSAIEEVFREAKRMEDELFLAGADGPQLRDVQLYACRAQAQSNS